MAAPAIDEAKLEAFMGQAVTDMGAIISAPLMVIGEKLGLYKAMARRGAVDLRGGRRALRRGRALGARVAAQSGRRRLRGLRRRTSDRYTLPDEQALALADEDSPVYILGVYESIASLYADEEQIVEASGAARGWVGTSTTIACSEARSGSSDPVTEPISSRSGFQRSTGVEAKLERGAKVADIGCGHGASTIIMAQAFPNSEFYGFDYHDGVDRAGTRTQRRRPASVTGSHSMSHRRRTSRHGDYDLVCVFDCLHDMGDPVGAAEHVRETLAQDGTWMIVEPYANDRVEDNLNPVGRVFYGASTVDLHPRLTRPGSRPRARRPGG